MPATVAIVGAGIVGLATAYRLLERYPDLQPVIFEKEDGVARHQSSHNSGVLHSGIYYPPGSQKARNCLAGRRQMEAFCRREGLPLEICGKLIVATTEAELPLLHRLFERGKAHGLQCRLISGEEIPAFEPHVRGLQAIYVPEAGIVDFHRVCLRLAEILQARGARLVLGSRVRRVEATSEGLLVHTSRGAWPADYLINCAGLYADHVARASGIPPEARILPFRGEYYRLKPPYRHLCRNLVYPVPHPDFPFLGVHFTRTLHREVLCGPNAVLACAREGYHRLRCHPVECLETLTYPGFHRLARAYWKVGLEEMLRSWSRRAFVRALQRLIPEVTPEMVEPAPAGVRAQAVYPDGRMVDDFLLYTHPRMIHVGNAPSPAATSALNIGAWIVQEVEKAWSLT